MIVNGKILTPKFFVIICSLLACVTALIMVCFASLDASISDAKAELDASQEEYGALSSELDQKSRHFDYMGTDDYIEAEAKRAFGLIKEGEYRYDIVDNWPIN